MCGGPKNHQKIIFSPSNLSILFYSRPFIVIHLALEESFIESSSNSISEKLSKIESNDPAFIGNELTKYLFQFKNSSFLIQVRVQNSI
jgi:hypothetical protein